MITADEIEKIRTERDRCGEIVTRQSLDVMAWMGIDSGRTLLRLTDKAIGSLRELEKENAELKEQLVKHEAQQEWLVNEGILISRKYYDELRAFESALKHLQNNSNLFAITNVEWITDMSQGANEGRVPLRFTLKAVAHNVPEDCRTESEWAGYTREDAMELLLKMGRYIDRCYAH
jgi:hypothetical protein